MMPRSDGITGAMHSLAVLLTLCAAALSTAGASAARVDTFSFPAFDNATTQGLVAATSTAVLTPASLLFDHDGAFSEFNRTEGFLLLSRTVDVWHAGPAGVPALEASFNTSFTLTTAAAAPVAFVVLNDRFPPLFGQGGLRGFANYSSSDDGVPNASISSLASIETGPVRSYGPDEPAVGLNVTVTPNGTCAVWIEYDAAAHRLSVRIAGAGEPRPAKALLDAPLELAGRATTETALVGFFAAAIRDIVVGVRAWDLTVVSFEGDGKKGTSWWVVLLAVLGSVAATAAIVTAAVCCFQSRRRRLNNMEPKILIRFQQKMFCVLKQWHMRLVLLVLCEAALSATVSGDVDTYSFLAFDATTAAEGDLVAVTNSSILGLSLLFGGFESVPSASGVRLSQRAFLFYTVVICISTCTLLLAYPLAGCAGVSPVTNRSEGFLLPSRRVDVWRAGEDGVPEPDREASFNTSFSLAGASPVAFVLLQDMYPPFLNPDGFRGPANVTFAPDGAASDDSLAAVEAGVVRAYGPDDPAVGLNVTVTPNGTATSRTVWIEYDVVAHRLSVYVAAAGPSRPPKVILDATISLAAGHRTTQNASVGFFAAAVRDVILGVRGWNLTVERLDDRFPGAGDGRKKSTSWVVILLALLGSAAAAAAIVSAVACCVRSRRRRQPKNMEPPTI
ncbi:hypothetical protein BAE44_0009340 [Dichanthelium oligosanthes]|uniref:Legume lectin domain-containing protein n=1 Tax=Dichanthelium oligosanthes TaxID=888268 RepID=A0A1E5VWY9_9POAL|nr:hypothetical protein BAE44_0009340 [Dichanthelium oligosanthes]